MALNDVKFQTAQGGLGRTADGEDHVSALLFAGAAPTAFGTTKVREYRDLAAAETDGITASHVTYGVVHYHLSEFFRIAPGASVFVCFGLTNIAPELLAATNGKVRQVGGFFDAFSQIGATYQAAANALEAQHAPCVFVVGYDSATAFNVGTAPDLAATQSAPNVAVIVSGSGSGRAPALATALGKPYIPAVGAALGALAGALVHENIGWVERFNVSNGSELEAVRLADGTNNPTYASLDALHSKRFVVLRKHIGRAGTYFNDSFTAVIATSDYAALESVRTMNKCKREVRAELLPDLNSPLTVDAQTGKLAASTVGYFEAKAGRPLARMQSAGEISGFQVYVNPNQDILATSVLQMTIKIVPRGVARNIVVQIGFAISVN
jgi:Protein of unknown function (DUF2586)